MAKDKGKKQPVASIHHSSVYQSMPCEPFFFINTWKLLRPQFLSHPFVLESHREEPSLWCRGRQEPFQKNASQSEA